MIGCLTSMPESKFEQYRARSWFGEYVRYNNKTGSIYFEIPPPFMRPGKVKSFKHK